MKTFKILAVIGIMLFAFQNLSAQSKWRWENKSTTIKPTLNEINFIQGVNDTIQKQIDLKYSKTQADTTFVKVADGWQLRDSIYFESEVDSKISTTGFLKKYGSTVKTASVIAVIYSTSSATLSDNTLLLYALEIQLISITCTSVRFFQWTAGSYTADQNNRIGLYKLVGTTYTLVASIANDANLWVNTSGSVVTKTFDTPYVAPANEQLYIGFLYNNSAQTTAPLIQGVNSNAVEWFNNTMWGTTNLLVAQKGTVNDLPTSFDSSTTARFNTIPMLLIF